MSTKRELCKLCSRPMPSCYCQSISKVDVPNKVLIIRDIKEALHPFNTAVIAKRSLSNCEIIDSNNPELNQKLLSFIDNYKPFLLFKNEFSTPLESQSGQLSGNFIVLDGTWKKAKRIFFENSSLQDLSCHHLKSDITSLYAPVRKACSEEFLSTIEAITLSLEIVNNDSYPQLLAPLKKIVEIQSKWNKK